MGGTSSRNKGLRGEREVIKILQPILEDLYLANGHAPPFLKRNLMQSKEGGYDIIGLSWMALEVKRQETLSINTWWKQTLKQTKPGQTPVLLYRKNRTKWRAMILATLWEDLSEPVDMTIDSFLKYFKRRCAFEITKEATV